VEDQAQSPAATRWRRTPVVIVGVIISILAMSAWLWATAGQESTDDAQVDGHVNPIAARVGGTVVRVAVEDDQPVEAGAVLAELDPRDFQVAIDKARAELADAEAAAVAATTNVPITSTTTASSLSTAEGSMDHALNGINGAEREVQAATSRLATAQANQRQADANATRAARDLERLRDLLAKDEVSHQQYDTTSSTADAARAAAESMRSQVAEAEHGIAIAESRLAQARAAADQARAGVLSARTGPEQVTAMRARASAADARVAQGRAVLAQSVLNLQYTTVKAPTSGIVSRKSVEVGQIVQPGQPLMAVVPLDDVWVIANFKETQLTAMRPGQAVAITVDAYGGKTFKGHVGSVAAATGAKFSLLPPENATGNFVKVVQRVPVKLLLDAGQNADHLLRPGLSVAPTVYTR
jgi:membrane fusion protein (multidrug efflux system)